MYLGVQFRSSGDRLNQFYPVVKAMISPIFRSRKPKIRLLFGTDGLLQLGLLLPGTRALYTQRTGNVRPAVTPISIRIRRLRRAELPADTVALARFLIGKAVVRELQNARISGRIVETEAYPRRDPAAHHYSGRTLRNHSMFLRRGHAYVYFSYGNHFMLNVSAEIEGVGGGVLIRALEPLEGIEQMKMHRQTVALHELTSGPGRLARALQIDHALDGIDLCALGPLWLGAFAGSPLLSSSHKAASLSICKTRRIGISRAAHRLLRFYERGNPFVSGPARLRS